MATARADLRLAAIVCGVLGLYDVLYVGSLLADGPLIGPTQDVLYADFLVFHAAARAWIEGKLALLYDIDAFTRFQNALYADHLRREVAFRPFFYPPLWLLMLLPFGWFAVGKAYALFMAVTAALATALVGWRDRVGWLFVLTSPAAVWVVLAGQNTFLTVALFYGGWRLIDRSPAAAGILLGLLAYKPQVWLLIPVALLAARHFRAFAWMIATVVALALACLLLFGPGIWLAFVQAAREASSAAVNERLFAQMYMQMTTLMAAARLLGLPPGPAGVLQLVGALIGAVAVWFAFRRHGSSEARTALLAAATFLVAPYTLNYDLLLLMPAVVILFRQGASAGFLPGERIAYLALWLIPTFGMTANRHDLPVMPLVILLFGVMAWKRLPVAVE